MAYKQLVGVLGAMAASLVAMLVYYRAASLFAAATLPADDPASRLAFALHWLLLPGLTLLAGVWAAARRGFYRDAINGSRTRRIMGWRSIFTTMPTQSTRRC